MRTVFLMAVVCCHLASATTSDQTKMNEWAREYVTLHNASVTNSNLIKSLGILDPDEIKTLTNDFLRKALLKVRYDENTSTFDFEGYGKLRIISVESNRYEINGRRVILPRGIIDLAKTKKTAFLMNSLFLPEAYATDGDQDPRIPKGCERINGREGRWGLRSAAKTWSLKDAFQFEYAVFLYPPFYFNNKVKSAAPLADSCDVQVRQVVKLLKQERASLKGFACGKPGQEMTFLLNDGHTIRANSWWGQNQVYSPNSSTSNAENAETIFLSNLGEDSKLEKHEKFHEWSEYDSLQDDYVIRGERLIFSCGKDSASFQERFQVLKPLEPARKYLEQNRFCFKCDEKYANAIVRDVKASSTGSASDSTSTQ